MIIETTAEDHSAITAGRAPRNLRLSDAAIAPPEVLSMLERVAASIRPNFTPASWLIVDGDEVVGLCSVTRPPENGEVDIGYGVAADRQGRGLAGAAVREVAAWAEKAANVRALTAETSVANTASQRILERAGFRRVGERADDEDGPLVLWRRDTA